MIPTAEEFLHQSNSLHDMWDSTRGKGEWDEEAIAKSHIEFAKLHVEAALKAASEQAKIQEDFYSEDDFSLNELKELADKGYPRKDNYGEIYAVDIVFIDKDSILNAYPLKNIK